MDPFQGLLITKCVRLKPSQALTVFIPIHASQAPEKSQGGLLADLRKTRARSVASILADLADLVRSAGVSEGFGGFSYLKPSGIFHRGTPIAKWLISEGQSDNPSKKMDENWGYLYFRKPLYKKNEKDRNWNFDVNGFFQLALHNYS